MGLFTDLVIWTEKTFAPYGALGLFILAFIESSFFPIPPDVLLIVLALSKPEYALWFAMVCTAGSILGALFGYWIGIIGKRALLERLASKEKIDRVHKLFNRYEGWAFFIAGFTPIPYKVFTIAGGVFYVNIKKMVIASIIGRGLRFFLEAIFLYYFGKSILEHFDLYSIAGAASLIIIYIIYLIINKKKQVVLITGSGSQPSAPVIDTGQENPEDGVSEENGIDQAEEHDNEPHKKSFQQG